MAVTSATIGVLALQGDVREHRRILTELGAASAPVRTPDDLATVDALVIPGGESTTMWRLARTFGLLEPLRERVRAGLPAYGSCAGMIMLADRIVDGAAGQETIGGLDVTVRRNAFGRQVDSFEADLDFPAIGTEPALHAVFIRAPWVDEVGDGVEVLARVRPTGPASARSGGPAGGDIAPSAERSASAGDVAPSAERSASAGDVAPSAERSASAGRIVAVRQGALLATSFHPELTDDSRVHALFLDIVKES